MPDIHEGRGEAAKPEVAKAVAPKEAVVERPVATEPAADATGSTVPEPKPAATPAIAPESKTALTPAAAPESRPAAPRAPVSISGASISSILNQKPLAVETDEPTDAVRVDPDSERKIAVVREAFIAELHMSRPRIAMAFNTMTIADNRISIVVPNEILHDEIMRDRSELLTALIETAGLEGIVELHVDVREDKTALRPIKVEDKLRFLIEKNPLLDALRRELDLDTE